MYIAIDIGGSKTELASFKNPSNPEPIETITFPTQTSFLNGFAKIKSAISQLMGNSKLEGIGIAFPGVVEGEDLKLATNLRDWENQSLIQQLQKEFKTKLRIQNDAVCAALSQAYYGNARKYERFIFIILGTGVGGAFVDQSGEMISTVAIEPEYLIIDINGRSRKTGGFKTQGLLGAYVASKELEAQLGKPLRELSDDDDLWNEYTKYLATGLNNLIMCFSPEAMIFSGGVIENRPFLLDGLRYELKKYEEYLQIPSLEMATTKQNPSLLGALTLLS